MGKLFIEVEDSGIGMDSGCIYSILQECVNHGTVVALRYEVVSKSTGEVVVFNDLLNIFDAANMSPIKGC